MNAVQLYEKETGKKCPTNQISYHEWHINYVEWLEQQVVKNSLTNAITQNTTQQDNCQHIWVKSHAKHMVYCIKCDKYKPEGY